MVVVGTACWGGITQPGVLTCWRPRRRPLTHLRLGLWPTGSSLQLSPQRLSLHKPTIVCRLRGAAL